jgi:hypothetical protein
MPRRLWETWRPMLKRKSSKLTFQILMSIRIHSRRRFWEDRLTRELDAVWNWLEDTGGVGRPRLQTGVFDSMHKFPCTNKHQGSSKLFAQGKK